MANRFFGGSIFADSEAEHLYRVGSTLTSAFAFGLPGVKGKPFLIGALPDSKSPTQAVVSGDILDSEGRRLFRLERNNLIINPLDCKKIDARGQVGYQILDSTGAFIFGLSTLFDENETAITTITAELFDSDGVSAARLGATMWALDQSRLPSLSGVAPNGSIGIVMGMPDESVDFARSVIMNHGRIPKERA